MFCPEMSKYPLQIVFYLRRVSMSLHDYYKYDLCFVHKTFDLQS